MIDKFKQFVESDIYNQLQYYKTACIHLQCKGPGLSFLLKPYWDDYEYVKRQICHFIASWDAPIYVSMYPDTDRIIVLVFGEKS